jgi:uncharacterized protein (TIGR02996 family)
MRTFEFKDAKSNKFWTIQLSGAKFTVTFGRIGTAGQTQTKTFSSAAAARKEHDKLVAEKLKKGYVETTPKKAEPAKPAKPADQEALEAGLAAHPDEVAAHSAYADYLMEQGDPRGEFVQVQLALEDEARPKAERDTLKKREAALLKKHAAGWMGDVGRFLIGKWSGEGKPYNVRFRRGWLDFVRTLPIPESLVEALAGSPEARLLRHLEVVYDMRYHPFDFNPFFEQLNAALPEEDRIDEESFYMSDPGDQLATLAGSPHLTNLRVLKYGFSDDGDRLAYSTMVNPFASKAATLLKLLEKCPRLEELYLNTEMRPIPSVFSSKLLGNLRVFQYYYGTNYNDYRSRADPYPLRELAENRSLKNLTTLRLHPGRDATINIDQFDALVRSKNLPALAHLQVHMTTYGDEGADRIVASGALKRLKTLDIGYGNMTDEGARMLAASPDLKKLELLNVSRNALTPAGVRALRATGVRVVAEAQHGVGDDEDDYEARAYLYEVDRE